MVVDFEGCNCGGINLLCECINYGKDNKNFLIEQSVKNNTWAYVLQS